MEGKKQRKQTAQQKLNNFLRSPLAKEYPLCPIRRAVLTALASYCYYKDECDPSISSILDYTQYKDKRTIGDALEDLQTLGLVCKTKVTGKRNKYKWLIPYVPDEEIYRKKSVHKSSKNQDN